MKQVRSLAFEYAKKLGLKYPTTWEKNQQAGKDWLISFRSRHPQMSLRKPENTSAARSFGFNRLVVNDFYNLLESILLRGNFPPNRILNLDETGITTVMNMPKVLAEKSQKQVGQFVSAERGELVTFLGIVTATGAALPPVYVFPRVHFKETFMQGSPMESLGLCNKSGWMTSELFLQVLQHIQKHTNSSKEHPVLILMDNHDSHVSIDSVEYARLHGMTCITFPPHTSHKMQPLDVSVYGPFKAKLKVAFNDWHTNNPRKTLTIHNIAELSKIAFHQAFTASNIMSGFAKPGIQPFNKLAFKDEDFQAGSVASSSTIVTTNTESHQIPSIDDVALEITVNTTEVDSIEVNTTEPTTATEVESLEPASIPEIENAPITPETVRPLPNVRSKCPKTTKPRKSRKGKATILTNTPEKEQLAARHEEKQKKKAEKEQKQKALQIKRAQKLLNVDSKKPVKKIRTK